MMACLISVKETKIIDGKLLNDLSWRLHLHGQTRCQMIGLLLMDCQLDRYHFYNILNDYNSKCAVSNVQEQFESSNVHLS